VGKWKIKNWSVSMQFKKYVSLILILLASLSITGCGNSKTKVEPEQEIKNIKTNIDTYLKKNPPASRSRKENEWYGVYLYEKKVGWMHISIDRLINSNRTNYLTKTTMSLSMKRNKTIYKIIQKSEVLENNTGNLKHFFYYEQQGNTLKIRYGRKEKDRLIWIQSNGKKSVSKQRVLTNKLLCINHVNQWIEKTKFKTGKSQKFLTFNEALPEKDIPLQVNIKKEKTIDILGEKKKLINVEIKMNIGVPVVIKNWATKKGVVFKMSMMDIMQLYRLPKTLALKMGKAVDILALLKIKSSKQINNPRSLQNLKLRIHYNKNETSKKLTSGVMQRIIKQNPKSVDLQINSIIPDPKKLQRIFEKENIKTKYKQYLKSTPFLESDDKLIRTLAKTIKGNLKNPYLIAKKIEEWVFKAITKKNLTVVFATALETAENLEGDCTEHAVLLAAICRAANIPSKVVIGLVYSEAFSKPGDKEKGAFYFHMWTEVYVGRWIALDATIGGITVDATHIGFVKSALETDSAIFDIFTANTFLSGAKIEILD